LFGQSVWAESKLSVRALIRSGSSELRGRRPARSQDHMQTVLRLHLLVLLRASVVRWEVTTMKRRTKRRKQNRQRAKLGLPDLEHVKSAVLVSLRSPESQPSYRRSMAFNKTVVTRYRLHLEERLLAPGTINVRLAAVRRLAYEAADTGLLSPDLAAGIR